ncbi:Predicted dehydrogenase [Cnuella takakiae]|uniref:Predicted dehydrogenase n=1 Tax=Cnuella takakiae TaxID=1302690 RepID=A0A1M4VZH4_9BACT|nr:Gfo/Idh/MocA family oxidoreductase [Cnuella takakiae]OLY92454.1 hypothetical protein BUE76_11575 [Cnuella takakiae]SHE74411.1 Predicted dehydrogenase [Cnuella takakiae]
MTQFALIGCGRIAQRHKTEILRTGALVAVCDIDLAMAQALAAGTQARVYTRLEVLLEQEPLVELVVVCTPNGLHAEHAIKSLQARRHVLCEKPLCIAFTAAWSMRDTAHFFRRKLFVVKQNRFNKPVLFARQILEAGNLGRILSFSLNGYWNQPQAYYTGNWHGTRHEDGGILYTQFSHFFDMLLWLLGDTTVISAAASNSGLRSHFEIEDSFVALLQTTGGALGTAHFSINAHGGNKEGSFTIIGEKGTMKIGGQYLNTIEWNSNDAGVPYTPEMDAGANDNGIYSGNMSNHQLVYDELQKALAGQPQSLPEAKDTVSTITLIEQLYAAARR